MKPRSEAMILTGSPPFKASAAFKNRCSPSQSWGHRWKTCCIRRSNWRGKTWQTARREACSNHSNGLGRPLMDRGDSRCQVAWSASFNRQRTDPCRQFLPNRYGHDRQHPYNPARSDAGGRRCVDSSCPFLKNWSHAKPIYIHRWLVRLLDDRLPL